MTIETATYVTDLNTAYPATSDPMSQGDDHLRLIKAVVKSTWGALGNQPLATTLGDYLTTATASSTYLTQASAASTYLTQANATSTYLTQANATSTYETIANVALKAPLASPTFTGTVTTDGAEINGELQIDGVVQMTPETLTSSAAIALSMTGANKKTLSLAHNTTITVSGEVANQTVEVWITSTGSFTAAWSGVDKWVGGSAPTLSTTSGQIDIIVLASLPDGTSIVGSHVGVAS